jgi:3-(3-hydroxy-phenyl)propionate hydroxylase
VRLFNGRRVLLDELLGDGFSLVGLNCDPRGGLTDAALAKLEALESRFVTIFPYGCRPQGLDGIPRNAPAGLTEVEDVTGHMVRWFRKAGFRKRAVAILRPDKFAFGVVHAPHLDSALGDLLIQLQWRADFGLAPKEHLIGDLHAAAIGIRS